MCTHDGQYCFSYNSSQSGTFNVADQACRRRGGVLAWYKSYEEQLAVETYFMWVY
jgi:hypothetical protein